MTKPHLFIGSSAESLSLAHAVQAGLQYHFTVQVWTQGIFAPSADTMGSLLQAARTVDYALFVLSPDDIALIRDDVHGVARDNVLFELGMFFGALGRERTFMLRPIDASDLHLPSDLDGVTALGYDRRDIGVDTTAAVGAACTAIRDAASRHRANAPVQLGRWEQEWTLDTPEGKKSFPSVAEVRVLGNVVRATFPWEQRTIVVEGVVEGGTLPARGGTR